MRCDHVIQDFDSGGKVGDLEVLDTWLARAKGLLFSSELGEDDVILLSPCSSVHTCFMRYAIDVVYLDRNKKVVKIKRNLVPYRFDWCRGAYFVLEAKANGAVGERVSVGQYLKW